MEKVLTAVWYSELNGTRYIVDVRQPAEGQTEANFKRWCRRFSVKHALGKPEFQYLEH